MPKKIKKLPKKTQPTEKVAHYTAILVEDLRSQLQQVAEGQMTLRTEILRELSEFRKEVNEKFDDINLILRSHSKTLEAHSDILESHTKIVEAHSKILQFSYREELKENKRRWDENQITLREILTSIKDVSEKVNRHEDEIQEIKQKIAV